MAPAPTRTLSSDQLADAAGITYRQLDYWCRLGVLRPIREAHGSGSRRRFDTDEIRVARAVAKLMWLGADTTEAAIAAARLRDLPEIAWYGYWEHGGRILKLHELAD